VKFGSSKISLGLRVILNLRFYRKICEFAMRLQQRGKKTMSEVKQEEHVIIKATPTKDELIEILSELKKILRATLEVLKHDCEKD
jgi:hypothetical protein